MVVQAQAFYVSALCIEWLNRGINIYLRSPSGRIESLNPIASHLPAQLLAFILAQTLYDDYRGRRRLQGAAGACILVLVVAHLIRSGPDAFTSAALWVNVGLIATAACLALSAAKTSFGQKSATASQLERDH